MGWDKAISIHHVPLLPNQGALLSLCEMVTEIGLNSLKVLRFVPQGRGAANEVRLALDDFGVDKLAEQIRLARDSFPALNLDLGTPYSMLVPCRSTACGAGIRTLSIGANLDCYPCDGFKSIAAGAYREPLAGRSLREFWIESATMSSVRGANVRMQMQGGNGCLAQKFLANGRLYGAEEDPLATYVNQHYRQAASQ